MNIDELCDKRLGELGMCSQAAECDVLRPLVLNLGGTDSQYWQDILCKYSEELLTNSET